MTNSKSEVVGFNLLYLVPGRVGGTETYARELIDAMARACWRGASAMWFRVFAAACGWHVLEHIPHPRDLLRALRRAVRPGGYVFFEVPNIESVLARRQGTEWVPLDPRHHVSQFSPGTLGKLLSSTGFKLEQIDTIPFAYLTPPASLRRPATLAYLALYALRTRSAPLSSHPVKHELIRVVARRLA